MLSAGAPNLRRTVAECTQPYAPPPPGAERALAQYLADAAAPGGGRDRAYLEALARAAAAPVSEAVAAKCAALIKQNLHRCGHGGGGWLVGWSCAPRRFATLHVCCRDFSPCYWYCSN